MENNNRAVGPVLFIGILFMPYIFCWLLFRKGYSKTARILGLVWLPIAMVIIFNHKDRPRDQPNPVVAEAPQKREESQKPQEPSKAERSQRAGAEAGFESSVIGIWNCRAGMIGFLKTGQTKYFDIAAGGISKVVFSDAGAIHKQYGDKSGASGVFQIIDGSNARVSYDEAFSSSGESKKNELSEEAKLIDANTLVLYDPSTIQQKADGQAAIGDYCVREKSQSIKSANGGQKAEYTAPKGNVLETVTYPGASTKDMYLKFKDEGGLNTTNKWHDLQVKGLEAVYDNSGVLKTVSMKIELDRYEYNMLGISTHKVSTPKEIRETLSKVCQISAANWHIYNAGFEGVGDLGMQCMYNDLDKMIILTSEAS